MQPGGCEKSGLVEGVLHRALELGIDLQVASFLPLDVLGEIRRLNVVRNSFSHAAAKSEVQANEIIDDAYPVLREVLLDLSDMQGIDLLRIRGVQAGGKAEVERLTGHAQSRRISEMALDTNEALLVMSATATDGMDRVFARVGKLTLDLSPFFYAADNQTGHRTNVWSFKRKKKGEMHMECVADSTTRLSSALPHQGSLVRFDSLLTRTRGSG